MLKPLPPNMVGLWGTGSIHDVNVDIQKAEAEIERKWAEKGGSDFDQAPGSFEMRGTKLDSQ